VGPARRLRGIVAEGRQPPRHDDKVAVRGETVGRVTSGNFSPALGRGIALALVSTAADLADGDEVSVEVRGKSLIGHVSPLPFVQAGRSTEVARGGR
jgi:aminomethyltransferase